MDLLSNTETQRHRAWEWLPTVLAALAFVGCVGALAWELVTYQNKTVRWAAGDIDSRAHLAAANLAEPLRTQDFAAIQRIGAECEADGVHLLVTSDRGGLVFSSQPSGAKDLPMYSRPCSSGEYAVMVGMPQERVMAPFKRALRGFFLAGLVGMAGVLLFFFVTYRQHVRIRELAKLETFRREFIADVSHEIKTPLTGILGAVDMLGEEEMDGEGGGGQRKLLLGLIKKEAKRLNGLVQSILDLARLEREGDVLNLEETDLGELVREAVESLVPVARTAGIELSLASVPQALGEKKLRADPQLVSQALSNLIVNAIRHSGSKDVVVSLAETAKGVRLSVEDHGVGIPPEHAAQIFERFHRVDPARAAETGGAGLGLAIVRRIARLHGGDVTLAPAQPHGCVFTLTLRRQNMMWKKSR